MEYVYHSSNTQGLKVINPQVSTHGKSWVYAMEKPEYCLMFLGNHGDIINQTGFIKGVPYIAERFEGALEYAYKNKTGSIYTLEGFDFNASMTTFDPELVCDHTCKVVDEEKVENASEKILQLELEGKIIVYRYPNLPKWIPINKSDLIEKVVRWAQKSRNNNVLATVEKFHPDILSEINDRLGK